jgi:hypothetical protein
MQLEKYNLEKSKSEDVFYFMSEGTKNILKIVKYDLIPNPQDYLLPEGVELYNLGFGDVLNNLETNEEYLSDSARSNNGDKLKVLNTVASTVLLLFEKYPNAFIYVSGNSPSRNREYRIGISKIHSKIIQEFDIAGLLKDEDEFYYWEDFEQNKNYYAFLMKKK